MLESNYSTYRAMNDYDANRVTANRDKNTIPWWETEPKRVTNIMCDSPMDNTKKIYKSKSNYVFVGK